MMTKVQILATLLFETVLPYLKEKIEQYLETVGSVKRRKVFEYLCRVCSLVEFIWQFRHLVDDEAKFYRPYLQFFRIAVRGLNQFEEKQRRKVDKKWYLFSLLRQYNIFGLFLIMRYAEWYFSSRQTNKKLETE